MSEPYVWTSEVGTTEIGPERIFWVDTDGRDGREIPMPNLPDEKARLAAAIVGDTHVVIRKDQVAMVPHLNLTRFESEELSRAIADAHVEEGGDA